MDCRDVLARLTPFLDDELDPVNGREISLHLQGCAACAATLERQRELGATLRRELAYHRASDLLRERVTRAAEGAVPRQEAAAGVQRTGRLRRLGTAAAFVAVAGGAWLVATLPRADGEGALRSEAVAGHVRSLMANHLTDVASTDQHTVKPWFAGKLDFSPPVTDFAAADYPLIGGRLDYLQGRPVAALVYLHRKHILNVFVWPDAHEAAASTFAQRGFHGVLEKHGGMAYCAVSDLNAGELAAFGRLLIAPQGNRPLGVSP